VRLAEAERFNGDCVVARGLRIIHEEHAAILFRWSAGAVDLRTVISGLA
jgi:hypothetical protein